MHGSSYRRSSGGVQSRGPETFFGYCQRSKQYRMMDLPDFMDNTQAGLSQIVADSTATMQRMWNPGHGGSGSATSNRPRYRGREEHTHRGRGDCGCGCNDDCGCGGNAGCQCHCECCVCDADVLVHARCGEVRRIPLTFENDTRRDTPVTLTLEKFVTAGGRDLGWTAALSEAKFTLHPCDEHTVSLAVRIVCKPDAPTPTPTPNPNTPAPPAGTAPNPNPGNIAGTPPTSSVRVGGTVDARDDVFGRVDTCEVGYATIRAEGCLTRPIVVAIAVLPDDCDASRHGCGCGCCND
jgi:hypothetical protein